MQAVYDRIRARAKALEADTLRFLADMIRVPSFSTREKGVINVIEKEMTSAGFDEVRIDGLGSIVGRIGSGPRVIAFDAHIDTVYPGDESQWSSPPFQPRIEDGKIWGRGTVDQEGGMAAMVCAGRLIKVMGLAEGFSLFFTGTVMEEDCDGLCWQHLIREDDLRPELVIITEPTNMNIYRGHRGRMEMEVSIRGVSCHGSAPERGDNAIYKMSRIALEIEKLHARLPSDPFLGKGSITISEFRSSSPSQCAVSDHASIYLDRRLTAGETRESAVEEVKDAAARAGYPDAEVVIPTYTEAAYTGRVYPAEKYYPTWTVAEDATWLQQAVDAYKGLFHKAPLIDKWTFSTNGVAIAGMHGIPCIGLGPGNEILAHAPNENCPIEHLSDAAAFYAALIARLGATTD